MCKLHNDFYDRNNRDLPQESDEHANRSAKGAKYESQGAVLY